MTSSEDEAAEDRLWKRWVTRLLLTTQRHPQISTGSAKTLFAAAEVMLSRNLTEADLRSICREAASRLYRGPERERRDVCNYLELLEYLVPILCRTGRRFSLLAPAGRERCLAACERSRLPLFANGQRELRQLLSMTFLDHSEIWSRPAVPLPLAKPVPG